MPKSKILAKAAQRSEVSKERFRTAAPPQRRAVGTRELKANKAALKPSRGRMTCKTQKWSGHASGDRSVLPLTELADQEDCLWGPLHC